MDMLQGYTVRHRVVTGIAQTVQQDLQLQVKLSIVVLSFRQTRKQTNLPRPEKGAGSGGEDQKAIHLVFLY